MTKAANHRVTLEKSRTGLKARILTSDERTSSQFDHAFSEGVFAIPMGKNEPLYNIRALDKYCTEHGLSPSQLTPEQLSKFVITSR
jgi:hypothetical protein